MMCFSLGDIFGHTGKKSGDDSDFSIHPSDQCIETRQPQCISWLGCWQQIRVDFQLSVGPLLSFPSS